MLENLEKEIRLQKRHIKILKYVKDNGPVGIIRLSELSGIPQHKVRYSLRVLEQKGIIRPSLQGALLTDKAREFLQELPAKLDNLKKELDKL